MNSSRAKIASLEFCVLCCVGSILVQLHLTIAEKDFVTPQNPHIIFILADDLGWNDVSFHGSPQIPTPNLDALASSGIILNNHYAECLCTPSRAALMTGRYPIRSGLQHFVIRAGEASGLPLDMTIMPQHLKKLGYATHIVGKWHLGYMRKEYTPIFRGFDTFFGTYNGMIDYYDYTHYIKTDLPSAPIFYGVDLRNGTEIVKNLRGPYATDTFKEKAMDIIKHHNAEKPLFLYLTPNAPHTGNLYMPLQAPPNIVNRFNHIQNESRKVYAAMVSSLDDLVGSVFETLHQKNMLRNSVVVFVSDNGGDAQFSSNHPLRGHKFGWWEGGIRVPAVVWSPLFKLREPRVSMQLMHVSDWLPTLYSAAGGNVSDLGDIDGHNMWNAFTDELPSPRQELLHALDPISNVSILRTDHLKLVSGKLPYSLKSSSGPTGLEDMPLSSSMDKWVFQRGSTVRDTLRKIGLYLPKIPDAWRRKAGPIRCENTSGNSKCDPLQRPCLFNITDDPCENNNIAEEHPKMVSFMMKRLEVFKKAAVKPQFKKRDLHSDPRCHGFVHVSWLDEENQTNCQFESNNQGQFKAYNNVTYLLGGKAILCQPFTPLECYRMYWKTLVE